MPIPPNIPITVNVIWDFSYGMLTHNQLAPPAIPAPVPIPSVEVPCTQMWTLGYLAGQNKFTTTVKHRYVFIVLESHDCGTMIPDVTIPPAPNVWYAIMWPFSKRQIIFSASTVKMNKKAVGCAQTLFAMPMMTCGDPISAPTSFVYPLPHMLNSVKVGMTLMDLLKGILAAAVAMALDFLFYKVGKYFDGLDSRIASYIPAGLRQRITNALGQVGMEVVKKLIPVLGTGGMAKETLASLSGFVINGVFDGNWQVASPSFGGPAGAQVSYTFGDGEGAGLGGQSNLDGFGERVEAYQGLFNGEAMP
ncbi:MAG TPA: hypothetical protein VKP65_21770 [Rhodothermales bacterium]|nr:hypothetical protein [Rhodothermales bacterium]